MSNPVVHITTRELADDLRVDASTIRRWVDAGKITPAVTTPGGHHRFVLDDVHAQLQTRSHRAQALAKGGEQS